MYSVEELNKKIEALHLAALRVRNESLSKGQYNKMAVVFKAKALLLEERLEKTIKSAKNSV